MNDHLYKISTLFLLILFVTSIGTFAKPKNGNNRKSAKVTGSAVTTTYMDINNLIALQSNVGNSDYNRNSQNGTEFPNGSGKSIIFESGLVWGGLVGGVPNVGGSTYGSGLQPGPILSNGSAADPTDPKWSIYRIRPDVYPGGPAVDLSSESTLEGIPESDLETQYENDWLNWPAKGTQNDLGAPFTDVNKDGVYEPNIDIPGVPGADQTIFYVANDLDTTLTSGLYGSNPIGIELHATYWAYKSGGALGNMYFKKYTLINKGFQHINVSDMYISLWADPDLGYANDDYPGTDTTLNLIYTYNGQPVDVVYEPDTPPSVGFTLFRGSYS